MLIMATPKLLLALILLSSLIYSATDIEKAIILNEPAIVDVIVEIKSTLTIESDVLPSLKELVSRSYVLSANKSIDGAIISADGYIITNNNVIENETIINETIVFAAPLIANDAGKIDHLKRFGKEIDDKETNAYKEYLFGIYDGATGFNKKISSDYADGIISIKIDKKEAYVRLSGDAKPIKAQFIGAKDGMALLKIDKNNLPVVELKNTTLQSGDQVYIINTDKNKTETNLIKNSESGKKYELLSNDENQNEINIISDKEGSLIGLELNDEVVTKDDINSVLAENSITEKPSITNAEFQEALDSYDSGNYTNYIYFILIF